MLQLSVYHIRRRQLYAVPKLSLFVMQSSRREQRNGLSGVYVVPSVVLSRCKRCCVSRVVQGVLARRDGITGCLPVYARSNGTMIDVSAWPVSVKAEMVISGRETCGWRCIINFPHFSMSTDLPPDAKVHHRHHWTSRRWKLIGIKPSTVLMLSG